MPGRFCCRLEGRVWEERKLLQLVKRQSRRQTQGPGTCSIPVTSPVESGAGSTLKGGSSQRLSRPEAACYVDRGQGRHFISMIQGMLDNAHRRIKGMRNWP